MIEQRADERFFEPSFSRRRLLGAMVVATLATVELALHETDHAATELQLVATEVEAIADEVAQLSNEGDSARWTPPEQQ